MSTYRAVFLGFLIAAIVLLIGDARRANTATTAPTHGEFLYTIAAGASSPPVLMPATNSPVTFNLATTTGPNRGTSSVVVCYSNAAPATITWSGHSPNPATVSGGAAVGGSTTSTGTDIVPLDTNASIFLRVSSVLNKLEIFNGSGGAVSAVLVWNF
jgi:hypothetical protein